jgi:hypothetical protein
MVERERAEKRVDSFEGGTQVVWDGYPQIRKECKYILHEYMFMFLDMSEMAAAEPAIPRLDDASSGCV